MYTELEKYLAIRQIISDYRCSTLADYQDYQRILKSQVELTSINNPKATKAIVETALDFQTAEAEYLYSTKVLAEMDKIFNSAILPQPSPLKQKELEEAILRKLNKLADNYPYSYIISNLAYEMLENLWFPFPVTESENPKVLNKKITEIFSYQDMSREEKIYYAILQLALSKPTQFKTKINTIKLKK